MRIRLLWNIPFAILVLPGLALGALAMALVTAAMWCEEMSLPREPQVNPPSPPYPGNEEFPGRSIHGAVLIDEQRRRRRS